MALQAKLKALPHALTPPFPLPGSRATMSRRAGAALWLQELNGAGERGRQCRARVASCAERLRRPACLAATHRLEADTRTRKISQLNLQFVHCA